MSTRQLQSKYEEVFGVPTKVHNKDWILSKISERVKLEVPVVKAPKDQPSAKSQAGSSVVEPLVSKDLAQRV